jgi:hypothetical protein
MTPGVDSLIDWLLHLDLKLVEFWESCICVAPDSLVSWETTEHRVENCSFLSSSSHCLSEHTCWKCLSRNIEDWNTTCCSKITRHHISWHMPRCRVSCRRRGWWSSKTCKVAAIEFAGAEDNKDEVAPLWWQSCKAVMKWTRVSGNSRKLVAKTCSCEDRYSSRLSGGIIG